MPWDTQERRNPPWTESEDAAIRAAQAHPAGRGRAIPTLPGRTHAAVRQRAYNLRRRSHAED